MRGNRAVLAALSLAALALAMGVPGQATAETSAKGANLSVDSGWHHASASSKWQPLATVTSNRPLLLTITDAYCEGDVMAIRDNGLLLGTTSDVPKGKCGRDDISKPWLALASDRYSNGAFQLKPGRTHHLQIRLTVNPFGSAAVQVRMDSPGAVWGTIRKTLARQ
jgi:hypothetical protein